MRRLRFGIRDIDILANDTKRLPVTAASKHPVLHFLCLVLQVMLPQGTGRNPYQIENIAVLADQRTIRFSGSGEGSPIKPPKRFGTKSDSQVPLKVSWVCNRHMASFPMSSFTSSKG